MTILVGQKMVAAMRYLALSGNNKVDSVFSAALRDVVAPDSQAVSKVTLSAPGTGYSVGDAVTFTAAPGAGAGAVGTVGTVNGGGGILTVNMTTHGAGYTSAPAVVFGGAGINAAGTAVLKGRDYYVSYEEENEDDFFKRINARGSARAFGGGVWVYLMSWGRAGFGSGYADFSATYRLRTAVNLMDMGPRRQEWKDYALAIHDAIIQFPYTGPDGQTLGLNANKTDAIRGTALEQHRPGFKTFDIFYQATFEAGVYPGP